MLETLLVLLWIGFSIKISLKGSERKIGFNNSLVICIIFTPFIANYIIEASEEIKTDETIKEHGKFYRVQRN